MTDINDDSAKDPAECISISRNKVVIKSVDMNEDMKIDAIDCAIFAIKKFNVEKDIAAYMKNEVMIGIFNLEMILIFKSSIKNLEQHGTVL
ncbi:hypothetical protein T552_00631 [Pneumocystis carinii B80]|uniref:Dynein light chain n=1 Tax=Pneumocystis carinii (strain B80) TaxID=1408658 RepID=A0A0W4ZP44_PNEC8|nr:hypothetical protein T552_00631 [Pneumocystis carinii B80]KTW30153.1 hypothetical protein T552_00631 [Pneumocystis carinii B80]